MLGPSAFQNFAEGGAVADEKRASTSLHLFEPQRQKRHPARMCSRAAHVFSFLSRRAPFHLVQVLPRALGATEDEKVPSVKERKT